jgi:hypothetical protein
VTIADRTRVQFKLEPPDYWPASERWPSLQTGHIRNSFEGGMHPAGGRDMYVIELDRGGVAFTDERSFVVMPPARRQVLPVGASDGLNDWDADQRPYDAALRIIADLHAAYAPDTNYSIGRGATEDIVTLIHPGGGRRDLTLTFRTFGSVSVVSGDADPVTLFTEAYAGGIEAARVWMHQIRDTA